MLERTPELQRALAEPRFNLLLLGSFGAVGLILAVIGLSGGVDSALTLAISVDAIGADRVEAVMMPSRYTSDISREDARAEAVALGIDYGEISIEPVFQAFLGALAGTFGDSEPDATEENIQARCRGLILMALSNKQGRIVLTTGNKSEVSVGYMTLYGDMAGGFAPIKDVPKMMVYRLSEYRNRDREVIPRRVIERPPSAELAPDQKDSDSLPPYEVLDQILFRYVEQDQSMNDITAAGFDRQAVERVARLVDRNEYKRRQAPPGVKINRIVNLTDDLALALRATSIRIVAPIPGKSVVGIEIPNPQRELVRFKEIVASPA